MIESIDGDLRPETLRGVFGSFPSGVLAVSALRDGSPIGMAASAFMGVSLAPPLVALCIQRSSSTWPSLASCRRLGLSVLAADQDALCRQIAGRGNDRFNGVGWDASAEGAVFLHGAAAWMDCSVYETVPAGDHELVMLELHAVAANVSVSPLVFHASAFRRLKPVPVMVPGTEWI